MTTAADLVADTRWHLLAGHTEARAVLQNAYTAASGTLTLTTAPTGIGAGHVLGIGLNVLQVLAWDPTTRVATVLGGQQGSTDANAAVGATVSIAPRFTDFRILRALNQDLADLSAPGSGLYQYKALNVVYRGGIYEYDLAADVISIDEIRIDSPTTDRITPVLDSFEIIRNADTAVFPSGVALRINEAGWDGRNLRIRYRAAFGTLTDLTTVVSTTGLPSTAEDLPPLGAAMSLMVGREIHRNDTDAQGDTRRSTEVGPGAVAASYRGLALRRQQRLMDEAARFLAQDPPQMPMPSSRYGWR